MEWTKHVEDEPIEICIHNKSIIGLAKNPTFRDTSRFFTIT